MIKRTAIIIFILLAAFAAGGCTSVEDTHEIAYVVLLGIDKGRDGKVLATYQVESIKKGDGEKPENNIGSASSEPANIITIEAHSMTEATDYLTSIVSRTPRFAHLNAIVIGEEYAKEGIIKVLEPIERYAEFRSNIYILVVNNGTAKDFIAKNAPPLESLPSKYISTQMYLSKHSSYFLESGFQEFYNRLKSNSAAPYAALAGINPQNGEEPQHNSGYYAGEIIRYDESNPAEIMGVALFREDKMVGKLSSEESRIVSMLKENFKRGIFYIDDPDSPRHKVGVELKFKNPPQISVHFIDKKPQIDIEMNFAAKIISIPGETDYEQEEVRRQIEETISKHVRSQTKKMLTKTQELGTDVIGFGYPARAQFKTYQEFMSVNWAESYSQAGIEIKVATVIESHGLMKRTTPINPAARGEI